MRLGPAHIHAQQHLGPILRFGAAGTGMDLEVAIIGIGLAREQALELALGNLGTQRLELALGLCDDAGIALRLAELDELELLLQLARDLAIAADCTIELVALAQQRLRRRRFLPEIRIFGLSVQLVETTRCVVPVKDASSAGRARRGSPRPLLESQRASTSPWHAWMADP
jgi:hypothetical protein